MLFIFSLSIIIISLIPIIFIIKYPNIFKKNIFTNHVMIFLIKIIIISMFIYIFISNLSILDSKLFIIVGCCISVIFHFIEGFVLQTILNKNGRKV